MKKIFNSTMNNIQNLKLRSSHLNSAALKYFSISVALVGYPNVGKSTFFNALVKRQLAEARNLPFCTIEPNIAKVAAVDKTLIELSMITDNPNIKAYSIEVMDVAGLIKGSMRPDGAGVQFLHCLRTATAIIQVLRCFKDSEVTYMDDKISPQNEMDIVQTELILSDIDVIDRRLAKGGKKQSEDEKIFLEKIKEELNSGKSLRNLNFKCGEREKKILDSLNLISTKPFVYVLNVDPPEIENEHTVKMCEILSNEDSVTTSVVLENEAWQLAEDSPILESLDMINNYFETFPNFKFQSWNLIEKIVKKLNYVSFYSVGTTGINQSWLLKKGSNIIEAANAIHSDFAKNFICAEITTLEDWRKYKDEDAIRSASKIKTVSRDYIVKDGNIVSIKFRK